METVTDGREWDRERDEARMRAAFVALAGARDSWPAPKHFLDALPPVPKPLALVREVRVDQAALRKNVAQIKARLAEVSR